MKIERIITVIFFFFGALPNVVRSALVSDICETERQLKCGVLLEISHQADGRRQKTNDRQIQHERVRERERGRVFCINGYFSVHTHTYTYTYSVSERERAREKRTQKKINLQDTEQDQYVLLTCVARWRQQQQQKQQQEEKHPQWDTKNWQIAKYLCETFFM